MNNNKLTTALLSGLAGAAALTVLHETVRRFRHDAPRMDTLGRRAVARGLDAAGLETPPENQLQAVALGGDVVANTLYYSLACVGRPSLALGAALGAAAGVGALGSVWRIAHAVSSRKYRWTMAHLTVAR